MKLIKTLVRFLAFALLAIATFPASAAFNAYAELTLNGATVTGDVSLPAVGGVDVSMAHIEIFEYRQNVSIDYPVQHSHLIADVRLCSAIVRSRPLPPFTSWE